MFELSHIRRYRPSEVVLNGGCFAEDGVAWKFIFAFIIRRIFDTWEHCLKFDASLTEKDPPLSLSKFPPPPPTARLKFKVTAAFLNWTFIVCTFKCFCCTEPPTHFPLNWGNDFFGICSLPNSHPPFLKFGAVVVAQPASLKTEWSWVHILPDSFFLFFFVSFWLSITKYSVLNQVSFWCEKVEN